ncbi:Uncharacterized protein PPKH_4979 [Pseudomonas putida]|nr:Uncharacterized protein PPKH_4979 [Pseudomonas putida]
MKTGAARCCLAQRRWRKAGHYTHRRRLAVMAPGQRNRLGTGVGGKIC